MQQFNDSAEGYMEAARFSQQMDQEVRPKRHVVLGLPLRTDQLVPFSRNYLLTSIIAIEAETTHFQGSTVTDSAKLPRH